MEVSGGVLSLGGVLHYARAHALMCHACCGDAALGGTATGAVLVARTGEVGGTRQHELEGLAFYAVCAKVG